MFVDLDFPGRFHIDYLVLCRWLSSVKKNYRDVTYHNWRHAFNVAQTMFTMLYVSHVHFDVKDVMRHQHFVIIHTLVTSMAQSHVQTDY